MRNLLFILSLVILVNCGNKTNKNNQSLIGIEFENFKEIDKFAGYTKISDTIIYENNLEPKYGVLHLQNPKHNLVIFKSISYDSIENRIYKILDTLIIKNLDKSEFITIGYCHINNGGEENIIALVDKTDSTKIQKIKNVWRANTVTNTLETVNNIKEINCFNEWYLE